MQENIKKYWLKFFNTLSESQKRLAAAIEALDLGYGGISTIREVTGLSRNTILKGINEIKFSGNLSADTESQQVRLSGGGRKSIIEINEKVKTEIEKILAESTAGDPMSKLVWTCKSVRKIADVLKKKGYKLSYRTVHRILCEMEYSLQSNRKTLSRAKDTGRDEQFMKINSTANSYIKVGYPVISVDSKKREQIGRFKNSGKTWRKKSDSCKVEDHDYASRAKGIAIPYGAYDLSRNEGFVNIGISADTADFSVNSIRQWWMCFGKKHYPEAKKILICADGGGSNGSVNRLWKFNLQKFATETGLAITVRHYPPGTSKWNKIEHRMFSYISINWRGQPLESYETVINLISSTSTKKGLRIKAILDTKEYKKGLKISDENFSKINIVFDKDFPKWNYTIKPI